MNSLKMVIGILTVLYIVCVGYVVNRANEREEKCSKVNGIVVQSQQGWICVDSHIIKGYKK